MSSISDLAAAIQAALITALGSMSGALVLAVVYAVFAQPDIRRWFGEFGRRDWEPRRRRRRFEGCAWFALACLLSVPPVGVLVLSFAPAVFRYVVALLLGGALLGGWLAFTKLRDPDNA